MELDSGTGVSIDMSSTGIFFETTSEVVESPSDKGRTIRFAICVKEKRDDSMRLNCVGRVMRIEPRGDMKGIGATIDKAFISRKQQG